MVGVHFGSQSCRHCGPFLMMLSALWHSQSYLAIVFVSKCASKLDTMKYFDAMPFWGVMLHDAATKNLWKYLF